MKRYLLFFFLLVPLFSCSLSPFETKPEDIDSELTSTVIEDTSLFVPTDNYYTFKTNNKEYLGENGYTVWCIEDSNTHEYFEDITVNLIKQSGKKEAGYGLVLLQQEYEGKDFLITVLINTKGQYAIGKVIDGQFSYIKQWQQCNYLNKGFGIRNKIKITSNTSAFVLLINDYFVTEFTVSENINIQNSNSGFVVVLSNLESFPESCVQVTFEKC